MRRLLLLVCVVIFVETMLYSALIPLLPHYRDEFGLSKSAAGLLVAAYAAGALAAALPGGIAAARYGPRRAMLIGIALMGIASLGFGFAGDAWTLGISRFAQGVGGSLAWAGALTWLIAASPSRDVERCLGPRSARRSSGPCSDLRSARLPTTSGPVRCSSGWPV